MYMAGRSLFARSSTKVALNLSRAFKGKLRISYSGADFFNMKDFYRSKFISYIATTILKPGEFGRLVQIGESFEDVKFKPFNGVIF